MSKLTSEQVASMSKELLSLDWYSYHDLSEVYCYEGEEAFIELYNKEKELIELSKQM